MTPEDAAADVFFEEMYENFREGVLEDWEVYDRIVDDFKEVRLRDYYLEHSGVIEQPQGMLDEAKNLLSSYPRASLVFAVAAGEAGLNFGILAPILHGCFHTESAANFLVETIMKQKNEKLTKALLQVLNHFTAINLSTFTRSGTTVKFWKEITDARIIRNRILHHGGRATREEATHAIAISETILNNILPAVLEKLGLHLHEGTQVCGSPACPSSRPAS